MLPEAWRGAWGLAGGKRGFREGCEGEGGIGGSQLLRSACLLQARPTLGSTVQRFFQSMILPFFPLLPGSMWAHLTRPRSWGPLQNG